MNLGSNDREGRGRDQGSDEPSFGDWQEWIMGISAFAPQSEHFLASEHAFGGDHFFVLAPHDILWLKLRKNGIIVAG